MPERKVDEWRWMLYICPECGRYGSRSACGGRLDHPHPARERQSVEVVPASLVDELRGELDQCRADLATAERDHVEAGDRADDLRRRLERASARAHDARCREVAMREERDALRAEAERLRDDLSRGRVVDRLDVSGVGAVICCDHLGPARPSCEHAGCGLVTLGELVECYSSPHTYAPPTAESARLSARVRELEDALWRCVELTGDDVSDGRPGPGSWPPLHERAIREVERLRRESEEGYDQDIAQARAEGARRERERLAPIVRTLHKIHDHCVGPDCGRGCVLSMQQDATAAFAEVFGSEWTWDALAAVLSDDEGGRDDGD